MANRPVDDPFRRRNFKSVALSDTELAAVDQVCARLGMTRGAFMREAVMEAAAAEGVEVTDDARRPAARRPNLSERQRREEADSTPVVAARRKKEEQMVRYRVYLQGTDALHIDVEAESAASAYETAASLELGEWKFPAGDITEFVERIDPEQLR